MNDTTRTPAPAWAQTLRRWNQYTMFDIGGGPRPLRLAWIINLQKAGSFPVMVALIYLYDNHSPGAWLYAALHGSYGLVWLTKDLLYPDPNWQGRAPLPACAFGVLGLAGYWLAGWLLISGVSQPDYPLPDPIWFALCVSLCLLGSVLMMAADVHKSIQLAHAKGLITTGLFSRIRHPNYLGEMMIYGSLALLAWHWAPFLVLAYFWGVMFSSNMAIKEASLSRHPGWPAYRQRSWWLIPGIF